MKRRQPSLSCKIFPRQILPVLKAYVGTRSRVRAVEYWMHNVTKGATDVDSLRAIRIVRFGQSDGITLDPKFAYANTRIGDAILGRFAQFVPESPSGTLALQPVIARQDTRSGLVAVEFEGLAGTDIAVEKSELRTLAAEVARIVVHHVRSMSTSYCDIIDASFKHYNPRWRRALRDACKTLQQRIPGTVAVMYFGRVPGPGADFELLEASPAIDSKHRGRNPHMYRIDAQRGIAGFAGSANRLIRTRPNCLDEARTEIGRILNSSNGCKVSWRPFELRKPAWSDHSMAVMAFPVVDGLCSSGRVGGVLSIARSEGEFPGEPMFHPCEELAAHSAAERLNGLLDERRAAESMKKIARLLGLLEKLTTPEEECLLERLARADMEAKQALHCELEEVMRKMQTDIDTSRLQELMGLPSELRAWTRRQARGRVPTHSRSHPATEGAME